MAPQWRPPSFNSPSSRRPSWRSTFSPTATGGWSLELKDLLAERTAGLTDPDDAPAAPEHPVSQTGDLWLLGKHRLLCGDSTVATDVERVLFPRLGACARPRARGGRKSKALGGR